MTQRVVQTFAERVKQRNFDQDLLVIYRVAGGMPSQRVEYQVAVDSVNGAHVTARDARLSHTAARASIPPNEVDVSRLFEQVSAGLHSLVPSSKAKYSPDALIGSLTIRVEKDEETFYFIPEEEKRRKSGQQVTPAIDRALQQFWSIAKRVSETRGDAKYE